MDVGYQDGQDADHGVARSAAGRPCGLPFADSMKEGKEFRRRSGLRFAGDNSPARRKSIILLSRRHFLFPLSPAEFAMRFEDLPLEIRRQAEQAACRFLLQQGYVSLDEACQELDLTLPDLWLRIQQGAALPESDPPAFAPFG